MLIIEIGDNENLSRALKRYRNKVRSTKLIKELRDRKHFTKPSVERRKEIMHATYLEQKAKE